MTEAGYGNLEHRVLLLAPTSKDAELTSSMLERADVHSLCCRDMTELCRELEKGCGAILLPEEAFGQGQGDCLTRWLARQPPWSDLPILILARPGADSAAVAQAMDLHGTVTVLERPTRVSTLVSAVRSALRARERQYQIRNQVKLLEAKEAELQLVTDTTPLILTRCSRDRRYRFANRAAAALFRRTPGEMIGRPIRELMGEEAFSRIEPYVERVLRGERVEFEAQVPYPGVGPRWVRVIYLPERDETGAVTGWMASISDFSDRKEAEEALRHSQQSLAAELAASQQLQQVSTKFIQADGVERLYEHILDAAVALMRSDCASIQMLDPERGAPGEPGELRLIGHRGFTPQAVRSWEWVRPTSRSSCGVALFTGERCVVGDVEKCAWMADSDDLRAYRECGIHAVQTTPLRSRDGRIVGMISTHWHQPHEPSERDLRLLDVLARQAADLIERKQAEDALREADRRKDEFLAILAHELRNPLAPIRNSLNILQLTHKGDPAIERLGEMMDRQVNHMVRMVDDLMEVSRITRGKVDLRKERIEVAAVLRSAVETSRPFLEAAGHQLIVAIPPESLTVEGDFVRLTQVVANILNNAVKYTAPAGKIHLTGWREGEEVAISVRDTGIGIPVDMLHRVFDPFMQIDRHAHRAQGGLGIGLTLVKSLVEMHGGTVQASSEGTGRGSEFVIRLPLASSPPAADLPVREKSPSPALAPRRVLVVDDNHDAADSLGTLLKMIGADVRVVYSGPDALKALETFKPAVILLDIGMPGMDGHEVARRIRSQPQAGEVTLIALTGWGHERDRNLSQTVGFDYHLIKPADLSALETLLVSLQDSPKARGT